MGCALQENNLIVSGGYFDSGTENSGDITDLVEKLNLR
jgi:hypothetical protein